MYQMIFLLICDKKIPPKNVPFSLAHCDLYVYMACVSSLCGYVALFCG